MGNKRIVLKTRLKFYFANATERRKEKRERKRKREIKVRFDILGWINVKLDVATGKK